jgi:hypothetical protein
MVGILWVRLLELAPFTIRTRKKDGELRRLRPIGKIMRELRNYGRW